MSFSLKRVQRNTISLIRARNFGIISSKYPNFIGFTFQNCLKRHIWKQLFKSRISIDEMDDF